MKLKGFDDSLDTGCMEFQLYVTSSHKVMSCIHCDFTSPTMLYADCGHVFCSTCILQLEENESTEKDSLVLGYCLVCDRPSTCMKIEVDVSFIKQLGCLCPSCSISLKVGELKPHLKLCLASVKFPPLKASTMSGHTSCSSEPNVSTSSSPDPLGPGSSDIEDSDLSSVSSEATSTLPKMVESLREEFLEKLATDRQHLTILYNELQTTRQRYNDLCTIISAPKTYKLRFRDVRGKNNRFYTTHVTLAGCIKVYFVSTSSTTFDHHRDVKMYVEGVYLDLWKRQKEKMPNIKLYVSALTFNSVAPRIGPFRFNGLPQNGFGEARAALAYTFVNVFEKPPKHGSEIQLEIEYN